MFQQIVFILIKYCIQLLQLPLLFLTTFCNRFESNSNLNVQKATKFFEENRKEEKEKTLTFGWVAQKIDHSVCIYIQKYIYFV